MISITAIIVAKPGHADTVRGALLDVAAYVDANEADTVSFYLARDLDNDHMFTTYERFTSIEARDAHNSSPATQAFFGAVKDLIETPVILQSCEEFSERRPA
ncbi:MAG: putative quinol monooxygenase [Pseudomonadota bacterium]